MSDQSDPNRNAVYIALIGAVAAIATAYISSDRFAQQKVDERITEIASSTLELRKSNQDYMDNRSGMVLVTVRANPQQRLTSAKGILDGTPLASATAHDSTVPGVPSISESSFVLPVNNGATWRIESQTQDPSLVSVHWFSPLPTNRER